MSSTARQHESRRLSPLGFLLFLAAHLLLVAIWTICESLAIRSFTPSYDCISMAISDLGVDYPVERNGVLYESPMAWLMNACFLMIGWLFGGINLVHLWINQPYRTSTLLVKLLYWLRIAAAIIVVIGLTLVGLIHGGPREDAKGLVVYHGSGAFFAMLFGHINSIIVGITGYLHQTFLHGTYYRLGSITIGVLGIVFEIFYTTQPAGLIGLAERATVYMVLMWILWTAFWLALELWSEEDCASGEAQTPLLA